MNIPITGPGDNGLSPLGGISRQITEEKKISFGETLEQFVNEVDTLQHQADESIDKLAVGEITDVHEVMIAVEQANTAMEFMLEIRDKIVEAYQEVLRMSV